MKKKICTLLAVLMLVPSFCCAHAITQDKAQHIGACAATTLVLSQVKPFSKWKGWQRALFTTIVIGGGKELYDHRHPEHHSADWADIGADAVGAFGAEGVVWLVHKTW